MNTTTPKTDAAIRSYEFFTGGRYDTFEYVDPDHARDLERENVALRAELDELLKSEHSIKQTLLAAGIPDGMEIFFGVRSLVDSRDALVKCGERMEDRLESTLPFSPSVEGERLSRQAISDFRRVKGEVK